MEYFIGALLLVVILFILFRKKEKIPENVKLISPNDLDSVMKKKISLVDVRTKIEYDNGHLKGARNININTGDFRKRIGKLKKDQPVYLYCASGNRSKKASIQIAKMGFDVIYDLEGGMGNWSAHGKKVVN